MPVDAFESWISQYYALVNRLCLRLTGSESQAQDAVQETSLAAWRDRESIVETAKQKAWLFGIARNVCAHMSPKRKWPSFQAFITVRGTLPMRAIDRLKQTGQLSRYS